MKWLIWSIEHDRWWAPNHRGYVHSKALAGRYSYDDALAIVTEANWGLSDVPNEVMCPDWEGGAQ